MFKLAAVFSSLVLAVLLLPELFCPLSADGEEYVLRLSASDVKVRASQQVRLAVPQKEGSSVRVISFGSGRCSWFGGGGEYSSAGNLACSLYPSVLVSSLSGYYCALRYDLSLPRKKLKSAWVYISANDRLVAARLVDWGPHVRTGRMIDLSPAVMKALGVCTDDIVTVEMELGG